MISSLEKENTILFWAPGGMPLMLHTEGALALALSYRDVKVRVVICDGVYKACMLRNKTIPAPIEYWGCQGSSETFLSCQQCKADNASVLEQMGVSYSFIGDYISESDLVESRVIANKQTWVTVKDLTLDGISLGNKITASVIRCYQGLYNDVDETIVHEYSRSAIVCALSARNCIEQISPARIFMPTGTYVDWGPALEVAIQMNIPISGWMSSYLSARFFFGHVIDRHRIVYQNISNSSWNNIVSSAMTEVQQSRLDNYIHARYYANKSFDLKKQYDYADIIDRIENIQDVRKKVGVLAHLNWDLAAEGSPMAYPTFNDWIIDTLNTIIDITDVRWFIKIHPAEAWESPETGVLNVIRTHFEQIPPHIEIIHADDNMSPLNFIQLIDVGVTVYGTAGLELALLGKPVILAGEAHYGGKGFTYDGLTPESYRQLLRNAATLPQLDPEQLLLAKKYAYCYFIQRQIPFPVVYDPESSWWKFQPHKIPLLLPGRDPFTDFICDRIIDGQDFIMPENLVLLAEKVYEKEGSSSTVSCSNTAAAGNQEVSTLLSELEKQIDSTPLKVTPEAVPAEAGSQDESPIDMKPILGFDSVGEVFTHDGSVYRGVYPGHGKQVQAVYDTCRDNGLFGAGIVNTVLVDREPFNTMGYDLVLQHERVPFISYAHEWTPSMLKDAALFQIDLDLKLLNAGLLLKDCGVSTNVLFDGTRPVFVDFLSIIPKDRLTDEDWLDPDPATRQHYAGFSRSSMYFQEVFKRMFFPGLLFPLYLIHQNRAETTRKRLLDTALNTTGDSITELETFANAAHALYFAYRKYRMLQENALRSEDLRQFLLIQRSEIEELNAAMSQSGYADYYESKGENFDFFPSDSWKPKHWGVFNALQSLKPLTVLDIGANTGWFSILAAKQGAMVVSLDNDVACMDILYRRARQEELSILPLIVDFLDPTSDVAAMAGLCQEPHFLHSRFENNVPLLLSADKRIACDMVIALAIVHHLCLGGGRHLDDVIRQLALFANKHLVLEFVTKDDPLIVGEPDFFKAQYANPAGFDWYSREKCVELLGRFFSTIRQVPLTASRILLVCTDKIEAEPNANIVAAPSGLHPQTVSPTNAAEFRVLQDVLESPPTIYAIGITNICNLRCPLCVTGMRQQKKKPQFLEFGLFQEIIEKIRPHAQLVQLYKWGESLLHPRIIDMLAVCDSYDLNTEISSNLSLENCDDVLEALVRHRLRHLIVSFDGVTQEDYSRYRVGGKLNLVLDNIRKIKDLKIRYNSEYPVISLQFLRNKFTGDQVQVIEDNYRQWGADKYYFCDMTTVFKDRDLDTARHWFSDQEIAQRRYLDIDVSMHGKPCSFLYTTMVIEQDGSIPSCCFATDPKDDFGQWDNSMSILEMYNSDRFVQARRMFRERKHCGASTCDDCSVFLSYLDGCEPAQSEKTPMVSVIIPSYNRARMLGITIESFVNQDYPAGSFEIIIADNNSNDDTMEVVADWQSRSTVPITYLFEQRQGVHYARNSAARIAAGDILYFTDDDMIADRSLLSEIVTVFNLDALVGTVTGRVLPKWEAQPPEWLLQLCYNSWLSIFDSMGDGIHIDENDFGVYSCHQAIRRDALFKSGGFNPESTFSEYVGDGETGLSIKLKENGYKFGYNGKSVIHHMIPASRMTQDYLNKRLANQGNADCYTEYKKHRFSSEQLADRIHGYVSSLMEKSSLCVDNRLKDDPRWRLDKAYTHYYLSRIEYDLRLIKDSAWRELVLKYDWINE